ncbi:MAG: hypothetical protein ACQKBT_10260 [Puniceicoccales bacterium]
MTQKECCILFLTLASATSGYSQWTQASSEDFEDYAFGESLEGTNWYKINRAGDPAKNQIITDETGGMNSDGIQLPPNHAGSGNGLFFFDQSEEGLARAGVNLSETAENFDIVYLSFDFAFGSVNPESTQVFGVLGLTEAENTSFGSPQNRATSVNLKKNGILTWSGGQAAVTAPTASHNLAMVANGSNAPFSYEALDGSGPAQLAPATFDLYLDQTRVGTSVPFTTDSIALGRFGITTYSSSRDTSFIIDNLNTFVPNP